MASGLSQRLDDIWYGADPRAGRWLAPLATVFGLATALRRAVYRCGILKSRRAPIPVVVVGNLTAGGTGKTPLVLWLVETLRDLGFAPGVVSRGYRSTAGRGPLLVTGDSAPGAVGDEPLLIARRTGVPVAVGSDRPACVEAVHGAGAEIAVSDDGLQHYRMARDLEIVVVDGVRGLGNGRLIPAGPLREPADRLDEVDAVVVNGGVARRPGNLRMHVEPVHVVRLADRETLSVERFAGRTVHAVAGIGHPEQFFTRLRSAGLDVIEHAFPDHADFKPGMIAFDDTHPVLMTEKDAVKCAAFADGRVFSVVAEARFAEPDAARLRALLVDRFVARDNRIKP